MLNQIQYPLVSVIVRSMDRSSLPETLASIGEQSYPNIEVIIINATGSPHSPVAMRYGNAVCHIVDGNNRLHRSAAANLGLDNAKGKYLCFLDDDDLWEPSHIVRLVDALQARPDSLVAYSGAAQFLDNKRVPIAKYDFPYQKNRLLAENYIPIHAVLFDKEIIEKGCRFNTGFDVYEDWDFWLQASKLTNFLHVPGVTAWYRIVSENVGADCQQSGVHIKDDIYQRNLRDFRLHGRGYVDDDDYLSLLNCVIDVQQKDESHKRTIDECNSLRHRLMAAEHELYLIKNSIGWHLLGKIKSVLMRMDRYGVLTATAKGLYRYGVMWVVKKITSRLMKFFSHAGQLQVERNYTEWLRCYENKVLSQLTAEINSKNITQQSVKFLFVFPMFGKTNYIDRTIKWLDKLHGNWSLQVFCASVNEVPSHPKVSKIACSEGEWRNKFNRLLESEHGLWVFFINEHIRYHALSLVAAMQAIHTNPDSMVLYFDHDSLDLHGQRSSPVFKPDWDPVLLRSANYIGNSVAFNAAHLKLTGGVSEYSDFEYVYDACLRATEGLDSFRVIHVSHVFATNIDGGSNYLATSDVGRKIVQRSAARVGYVGEVTETPFGYRIQAEIANPWPLVSIVIPTRNAKSLVQACIDSLLELTTYPLYEIIVVNNGSDEEESLEYINLLRNQPKITVLDDPSPFNYSALNNRAVQECAKGDVVVLLNNDITIKEPNWLQEMVFLAIRPEIGAVGARLWYPNNTLQHGGVLLIGGVATHAHPELPYGEPGYCHRAQLTQTFSAVTAACLAVQKSKYLHINGLDEQLKVAFNDVDFCLRLRAAGYRNVWTPYAELYHHESATRGQDLSPEKRARFESEIRFMQERWGYELQADPAMNPNLSYYSARFELAWPPQGYQ